MLAAALARGAPAPAQAVKVEDVLHLLLNTLLTRSPAPVVPAGAWPRPPVLPSPAGAPVPGSVGSANAAQLLQVVLAALAAKPATVPGNAISASASPETALILSPIDKVLGGQALAGKKTALSIVAYAVLAILQAVGVVGAATPAGQILTVVITAFGALGGISKVDRVIQALAMIAAKVPKGLPAGP
jgi:hypothetical protein